MVATPARPSQSFSTWMMVPYAVGTRPNTQMARMHLPSTGGGWPVSYDIGSEGETLRLAGRAFLPRHSGDTSAHIGPVWPGLLPFRRYQASVSIGASASIPQTLIMNKGPLRAGSCPSRNIHTSGWECRHHRWPVPRRFRRSTSRHYIICSTFGAGTKRHLRKGPAMTLR